jgi:3D-(3,5/4)-trihydroxycyclohexane-1,2-dione acylhydrolase (decyclizing)
MNASIFLMAPSELVTAAQEGLAITVVIPENRGYQVIHRLQMLRSGREFGNEFRYRDGGLDLSGAGAKPPRLEGDYLDVDLVKVAEGLGAGPSGRPPPTRSGRPWPAPATTAARW